MVYFHKGQLVLRYALVRNLFFINCLLLVGIDPQTPTPARINSPLLIQSVTLFKPAGYFNFY